MALHYVTISDYNEMPKSLKLKFIPHESRDLGVILIEKKNLKQCCMKRFCLLAQNILLQTGKVVSRLKSLSTFRLVSILLFILIFKNTNKTTKLSLDLSNTCVKLI